MPDRRSTSAFAVDRNPTEAFDVISNIRGCGSRGTKAAIDVPLAVAIVGLGILIIIAPSSIPGLAPPM